MAEEIHQERNVDCADVQPVIWNPTYVITQKLLSFLNPLDLSCYRLVCKRWKDDSSLIWEQHRVRHTLNRFSEFGLESIEALSHFKVNEKEDSFGLEVQMFQLSQIMLQDKFLSFALAQVKVPELTIYSKHRPPEMECDFDSIGAEDLRVFFSGAKHDVQLKDTSFLVINLRKWNRFGNFSLGEQEGARWFLNEIADKVMHLTLDTCNFSISKEDFFPTLCRMTQLKRLTIRGTYFQLRPSFPVQPTLAELTPLPNLRTVEINFKHCSKKRMPNYYFPWKVFLQAMPNMETLVLCYSNSKDLNFLFLQLSIMLIVLRMDIILAAITGLKFLFFKNVAEPNKDPEISKADVRKRIFELMEKLWIPTQVVRPKSRLQLPHTNFPKFDLNIFVGDLQICIGFRDREDKTVNDPISWN